MMRIKSCLPLVSVFLVHSIKTHALLTLSPKFGVGGQISTMGLGIFTVAELTDLASIHAGYNMFSVTRKDHKFANAIFDTKLRLRNGELIVHVYPFAGTLRLNAGIFYNTSSIRAIAKPISGTINLNGRNVSASTLGAVTATVSPSRLNPYIGLGWDYRFLGCGVALDIGVTYIGTPKVTLHASNSPLATRDTAVLEAERLKIAQAVRKFRFYPTIGLKLYYYFG